MECGPRVAQPIEQPTWDVHRPIEVDQRFEQQAGVGKESHAEHRFRRATHLPLIIGAIEFDGPMDGADLVQVRQLERSVQYAPGPLSRVDSATHTIDPNPPFSEKPIERHDLIEVISNSCPSVLLPRHDLAWQQGRKRHGERKLGAARAKCLQAGGVRLEMAGKLNLNTS